MKDCIINGSAYTLEDVKQMKQEDYVQILATKKPHFLYKYFPNTTNQQGMNHSIEAIIDNKVYMQSPINFDDPYDSTLMIDENEFNASRIVYYATLCGFIVDPRWDYHRSVFEFAMYLYNQMNNGLLLEQIFKIKNHSNDGVDLQHYKFVLRMKLELTREQSQKDVWQRAFYAALHDEYQEIRNDITKKFRVSCFTTTPYSMLMWSHYANSHRGFCIEYEMPPIDNISASIYSNLYPVIYSEHRISVLKQCVKFLSNTADKEMLWSVYKYGLLAKSSEWKHQNEWRLLLFDCKEPTVDFFPITKVHLGTKMDIESRKNIVDVCKKKNIPYSGMLIQNDKYQLYDCNMKCEECPKMKQ